MSIPLGLYPSISSVNPDVSTAQLMSQLVPPREFAKAGFDNYVTDANFPSQAEAVAICRLFAAGGKASGGLFAKKVEQPAGLYLDGGFGVGKTHLLASIWHQFKGKKAFGSFLAFTGLIGVLGFANAVVKPLLILFTLPLTIVTMGLFLLVVNALVLMLVSALVSGFTISSFWTAFFASIFISIFSLFVSGLVF